MCKRIIGISSIAFILLIPYAHGQDSAYAGILRSVYVCGPEFGNKAASYSNDNPGMHGTDYWFNTKKTFEYLKSKGFTVFRIPLMWERLQPIPGGALDRAYVSKVRENVTWASELSAYVILTIMNQGRYSLCIEGKITAFVIDEESNDTIPVRSSNFSDLWKRVSSEFKDARNVLAYGLMNEPHDMGEADWKKISQSAVTAIRDNEDGKLILVEGDGWSTCDGWSKYNPLPWIKDPLGNFMYEASCFLDSDGSGSYRLAFEEELARDPKINERGPKRLAQFIDFCRTHKVRGSVSSIGVPANDARWLGVLDTALHAAESSGAGWAYWAAGEWWKKYQLSVQPDANSSDKPQMKVLSRYLARGK